MIKLNYDNRVIFKPWGEEYNIFRNKKKIAITYLKIKKGFSTSLHCHPKKKNWISNSQRNCRGSDRHI